MNNELQIFARTTLKENLTKCTRDQQHVFKRMYSPENLDWDINKVVDEMPADRLDWAMQQVQRTVDADEKVLKGT